MYVHYVPCEIQYNGPALVSKYLVYSNSHDTEWPLETSFRGRPWRGRDVSMSLNRLGLDAMVIKSGISTSGLKNGMESCSDIEYQDMSGTKAHVIEWKWDPFDCGKSNGDTTIMCEDNAKKDSPDPLPWARGIEWMSLAMDLQNVVESTLKSQPSH